MLITMATLCHHLLIGLLLYDHISDQSKDYDANYRKVSDKIFKWYILSQIYFLMKNEEYIN